MCLFLTSTANPVKIERIMRYLEVLPAFRQHRIFDQLIRKFFYASALGTNKKVMIRFTRITPVEGLLVPYLVLHNQASIQQQLQCVVNGRQAHRIQLVVLHSVKEHFRGKKTRLCINTLKNGVTLGSLPIITFRQILRKYFAIIVVRAVFFHKISINNKQPFATYREKILRSKRRQQRYIFYPSCINFSDENQVLFGRNKPKSPFTSGQGMRSSNDKKAHQ